MKKLRRRWIFLESYNEILARMLRTYEEESGFAPENESDIMLRMRVLAGELFNERAYAEYILRQMFPSTAVGEYLDAHAQQRGLSRKSATYATGSVTFTASAEEHEDILIPAGTVVCTMDGTLRFLTDSDKVMSAGVQNLSVDVTAAQTGSSSNVKAYSIGVIVTPVLGIGAVKNSGRLTGGTDDESDEELRARVVDSYRNVSNGANAAYYRSIAMSVDGVYSASVVGCGRGTGTVDVYACGKAAALSDTTMAEIQKRLDEAREVNVDVKACVPSAMNINLYIRLTVAEGYDFDTVATQVYAAVCAYINGLGLGNDLWLSDVGEVIYHIEGVAGYKFLESYGSDREVPPTCYPVANTILVRDE